MGDAESNFFLRVSVSLRHRFSASPRHLFPPAGFHAEATDVLADSGCFYQGFDLMITPDMVEILGPFLD